MADHTSGVTASDGKTNAQHAPVYVYFVPWGDGEFLPRLTVGVQTFSLQYPGTVDEATFTCNMLTRALERAGATVLRQEPPEDAGERE